MTWKRVLAVLAVAVVLVAAVVVVKVVYELQHTHTNRATSSTPIPTRSAAPTSKEIAYAVADRFCQPDKAKNAWQRSLTPYLTPEVWQLYSAVRPGNVLCAGVHDDGQPVGDQQTSTDQAFQFTASTGGPVTVTLHRDTKAGPWLASYINAGK
ncbi:hypothetical protein [Curtobacterium sp. VKM Ac-1376]|uniref:hypothetical protein n=1 Tax=Curtobacterium sp. VKM Ac-1376 TaxID=123312 RepID=UPI00188DB0A9|nr:hypothetical protein [Curtobacterium sp. VKM Ac-1376]MBF4615914.1 hypothetical protein [Curtobacterium sp. VKM Ac-1376]